MGSCAQFLRGAAVPAPHGVGSCAQFLQGIVVPAPHVFQTDGFLRPFFTRGGGSCALWRRFLRLVGRGSRARAALAGTWRPSFQAAGRALPAPYNNESIPHLVKKNTTKLFT